MTELDAARAICDRFVANWNLADGRFALDNEAFDPDEAPGDPWLRLSVKHFARALETMGPPNRRWRAVGSIFVQVFVPRDSGTTLAHQLAQKVRVIFEGREVSGVKCYQSSTRELGIDGPWWVALVETAFDYDEQR